MPPPATGNTEEKALVAACLAGKDEAWTRFVERYGSLVWAAARRALRARGRPERPEVLEDLYGEVFAALCRDDFRHLRNFQWRCSLAKWIALLAHSTCLNALSRRGGIETPAQEAADWADRLPDDAPPTLSVLEKSEALELLREALAGAPPRERLILQLSYLDNLSYAQIAQVLGVSVNSVGPLTSRALARLRRHLGENS